LFNYVKDKTQLLEINLLKYLANKKIFIMILLILMDNLHKKLNILELVILSYKHKNKAQLFMDHDNNN